MKKITVLLVLISFCLLFSSCGADEAETEILYPGETVLLENGSPIIISENDIISCCGVHTDHITNPDGSTYARGILIYPDMLNAILAFMVQ